MDEYKLLDRINSIHLPVNKWRIAVYACLITFSVSGLISTTLTIFLSCSFGLVIGNSAYIECYETLSHMSIAKILQLCVSAYILGMSWWFVLFTYFFFPESEKWTEINLSGLTSNPFLVLDILFVICLLTFVSRNYNRSAIRWTLVGIILFEALFVSIVLTNIVQIMILSWVINFIITSVLVFDSILLFESQSENQILKAHLKQLSIAFVRKDYSEVEIVLNSITKRISSPITLEALKSISLKTHPSYTKPQIKTAT